MHSLERGQDYFEILPEGWIEVTHGSSMPVYLHKQSRVCTLAKPYHIGNGSVRKHEIPVSAIPCLQYKREKEKELQQEKILAESRNNGTNNVQMCKEEPIEEPPINNNHQQLTVESNAIPSETQSMQPSTSHSLTNDNCSSTSLPTVETYPKDLQEAARKAAFDQVQAKVETVQDHKREKSLSSNDVKDYCAKLFDFVEIKVRKFKTWADRRRHNIELKKERQRPSLPGSTKLITCSLANDNNHSGNPTGNRKEFVMNPAGKSYVCILHEFIQHRNRVQPKYEYKELENASTPYSATVFINDMAYGVGFGSSKKQAKSEAARKSIEILIPQMKEVTDTPTNKLGQVESTHDLNFFENIKIEDDRVSELCARAGQQTPYQILVECLKRNAGICTTNIEQKVRLVKHQRNEYTMSVGEHKVQITCKNKTEGKQRAAQAILQKLHPEVTSWGGLLKMYGRGSCKTPREKKEEEQKITELQSTASPNRPNYAILNKLKEEMLKLQ